MAGPKLPGELTWPKMLGTCLAAVVAAWLAGYLGLGNTLSGVAIGSVIATFGAAFFTTTIDKTHKVIPTVLVRTDRGTVVEAHGDQEAFPEDAGGTTVLPAQPYEPAAMPSAPGTDAPSRWSQIPWKSVAIASLITMAITLGAISIYEGAVGRTWGSNEPGTSIGNTVRGGPVTPAPSPTAEPTDEPTPSASPTDEPTPSASPSGEPTPSPSPSDTNNPDECATPTASPPGTATPSPTPTDCPTAEPTDDAGGGLLGLDR